LKGQTPFLEAGGMSGFRVEAANPRSSAEVSLCEGLRMPAP
jgi:hypothetical protein